MEEEEEEEARAQACGWEKLCQECKPSAGRCARSSCCRRLLPSIPPVKNGQKDCNTRIPAEETKKYDENRSIQKYKRVKTRKIHNNGPIITCAKRVKALYYFLVVSTPYVRVLKSSKRTNRRK